MSKDGKLSAYISAVIGLVPVVLDVTFDIGDILAFFKELWTEIGKLMTSVGGAIKLFFEEGLKVAEAGFEIALVEGKKFVEDAMSYLDSSPPRPVTAIKGHKFRNTGGIIRSSLSNMLGEPMLA